MEKGAETFLCKDYDENGVEISGGEAQKIAIARALYKDAPIVVLDEPIAVLDPISEFEIYSSFNQMVKNKMSVLFPTGYPPADSAMKLQLWMKEDWFSWEIMMRWLQIREVKIMNSGMHRHNIIKKAAWNNKMKQHMIDYVKQFDKPLVSPIWGGKRAFPFLCLGHLDLSHALGFELEQVTPVLTIVKEGQLQTDEQLDELIREHKFDYHYFDGEIQYLHQMKEENPDHLCGGGCFGPLTVVSGILGAENMLRLLVKNPEMVERFVAYVTDYMIELAVRETEEGEDFFWIAEPLASLLSPRNFWKFSGQYLKKIYEASQVPGFLHVCGKTIKHTKYMEQTGAEALSIDSCTDIGECIRMVNENVIIMGNVSPNVLLLGTKQEVEKEVQDILEACEGFPNFVLSTGCSIMGGTSDENMQVMFDLCK